MTDRNTAALASASLAISAAPPSKPIWMKQAEEAKLKSEAETTAAAKAAFEATFKSVSAKPEAPLDSESDEEADDDLSNRPVGPVDPAKCTATGTGITGGTACAASTFVVVTKDSDGRKVLQGGAQVKVTVSPGVGVGGTDQEGIVKDTGDGSYTVNYVVPKRGNYMVNIEVNGKVISGSPFPVFFSSGTSNGGLMGLPPSSTYQNLNQTMPNMPNYTASVSGAFPSMLGMVPGVISGVNGGAILPGIGASLGEVCREYLNGRCARTDCKLNHPPHNLLMTALAATTSMGTLSQVPMAPSAAAMAAAQAIMAAKALEAHAAQVQAQSRAQSAKDFSGSPASKEDALKRTLQVSNLSSLLTVEQLKQLFSFCGTVVDCCITDSKHFAYIEYSKPEEATAALALNSMDVGGRRLNVEMAKSLPQMPVSNHPLASSSLPVMMQQAVAMQQMQFQQALIMQQTMTAQQAANRAASMKSATELAAARAAEISKKLKADGFVTEEKKSDTKSRTPSPTRAKSRSKSRSPVSYRRRHKSPSYSPPARRYRHHRSRSPLKLHSRYGRDDSRRSYRERDDNDRNRRLDKDSSHYRHSSISKRNRSRSVSPRTRRSHKVDSGSRSPRHHDEVGSRKDRDNKKRNRQHSRSSSREVSNDRDKDVRDEKRKRRERRKSRSLSVEVVRKSSRSSIKDARESKNKRRSRSKSVEPEISERKVNDNDDRSKRHARRRSRSRSADGRHDPHIRASDDRSRRSDIRDRKHSDSVSPMQSRHRGSRSSPIGEDENKSKRRMHSRSVSPDSKHHKSHRKRDERPSKHHHRRRSPSPEEKYRRSSSPEKPKSKSADSKHQSNESNNMKVKEHSRNKNGGPGKSDDAGVGTDSFVKDMVNSTADEMLGSKHERNEGKEVFDGMDPDDKVENELMPYCKNGGRMLNKTEDVPLNASVSDS